MSEQQSYSKVTFVEECMRRPHRRPYKKLSKTIRQLREKRKKEIKAARLPAWIRK